MNSERAKTNTARSSLLVLNQCAHPKGGKGAAGRGRAPAKATTQASCQQATPPQRPTAYCQSYSSIQSSMGASEKGKRLSKSEHTTPWVNCKHHFRCLHIQAECWTMGHSCSHKSTGPSWEAGNIPPTIAKHIARPPLSVHHK